MHDTLWSLYPELREPLQRVLTITTNEMTFKKCNLEQPKIVLSIVARKATSLRAPTSILCAASGGVITGAFGQLFHRYHKRIFNIAMHVLQNESDAADATQEVFVRAYHSISTLKSDAAFVTWLKTMTINRCRDILRKRKREKLDSLDSAVENS